MTKPLRAYALALLTVLSGASAATALVGCAATDDENPATSEDAVIDALKTGTYKLSGTHSFSMFKQLVLKSGGTYEVQMYRGPAFPDDSISYIDGTYTASRGKLTLNLHSGNALSTWTYKVRGSKVSFHSDEYANDFDMTYASSSQVAEVEEIGTDPGKPASVAGGTAITCQSTRGYGDIRANIELKAPGTGQMFLTSSSSLNVSGVSKVRLGQNDGEESDSEWIRVSGGSSSAYYRVNFPADFVQNGGQNVTISLAVSDDIDAMEERSHELTCSSTGAR
ncbi:hypothetical protein [Labilithrix luteola]|nr:hypothetical protein [Labilithrix luteola]